MSEKRFTLMHDLQDDALAAFQAVLLDHLERGTPPHELKGALLADPAGAPFADYINSFEPRCVEMASRIVKKWAVRTK